MADVCLSSYAGVRLNHISRYARNHVRDLLVVGFCAINKLGDGKNYKSREKSHAKTDNKQITFVISRIVCPDLKGTNPTLKKSLNIPEIQGVRGKFDTFCFRYISKLFQDIDIG